MSIIWKQLKPCRWYCLGAVLMSIAEANCELLLPTLMSRIIGEGVRQGNMDRILQLGTAMLGVALLGILCVMLRNFCSGNATQRFAAALRHSTFDKILKLSESEVNRFGSASLIERVTGDSDQLAKALHSMLRVGVKIPALCAGSLFYMLRLQPKLGAVVLAVLLLALALIASFVALSNRRFAAVRRATDRLGTVIQEFLQGIRLIKALGREEDEERRFRETSSQLADEGIRLQLLNACYSPMITLTIYLGMVAVLALSGAWAAEAETVSAFVLYLTQLISSMTLLIDVFRMLVKMKTSAQRIQEVLTLAEEEDPAAIQPPQADSPALEFRHVSFAYPGGSGTNALTDISFSLERGETLAIIGPTGSGKSTLAWLCARLYDPQQGQILLHGADLRQQPLKKLRHEVALAAQESALFTGTVEQNLAMGDPTADDNALYDALWNAQATGFVSELGGLEGALEQAGGNLSGGQRQRLSLARTLLRGGSVLILDDATSALDTITEKKILAALDHREDRALLLITQRVRTAEMADKVLVLENGRQVGFGSHRELLTSCPVYREIWTTQTGEEAPHGKRG